MSSKQAKFKRLKEKQKTCYIFNFLAYSEMRTVKRHSFRSATYPESKSPSLLADFGANFTTLIAASEPRRT